MSLTTEQPQNVDPVVQKDWTDDEDDPSLDLDEDILKEENRRFTVFPIRYQEVWDMYKAQQASMWTVEEIDISRDRDDFESMTVDEQNFLKNILGMFASADGLISANLSRNFLNDVKVMEINICYAFQMMMEGIHGHMYSLLIETLISDKDEKERLFNSLETIQPIKELGEWSKKWIHKKSRFVYKLIAFACVEAISFAGSFCGIYWLKKINNKGRSFMPALCLSNDFISRDESMHARFACLVYSLLKHKLKHSTVHKIVKEVVEISKRIMCEGLQCKLIGMNAEMMCSYIEYVADRLLVDLNCPKVYNASNPFPWMNTIGGIQKQNMFEGRSSSYASAKIGNKAAKSDLIIAENEEDF